MEGYIDGSIKSPLKTDLNYTNWKMNDRLILSWLLNSMQPEIANLFILSDSSWHLWNSVNEIYGQQQNYSHVFKLKQEIAQIKQGGKTIIEVLGAIKSKYDELNIYMPLTTDLKTIQSRNEQEKIFAFLAALDSSYEAVRSQILLSSNLSSFASVVAQVQREESRRKTMPSETQLPEGQQVEEERSATAADRGFVTKPNLNAVLKGTPSNNGRGRGQFSANSSAKCYHCHRTGHTKEGCWCLHPHLRPAKKEKVEVHHTR